MNTKNCDLASTLVDNFKNSPFITHDVLAKHIEHELDRIEIRARRSGQKEMEDIFTDYCKRNNIKIE